MPRGSHGPRRITESIEKSDDAFGNRIADGRRNLLDIASQYRFTPERLRLFLNGARQYPQYDSIPEFRDTQDSWDLLPSAGDTMYIESAESATYVVNYELESSMAFGLNQELQDGDVLRVGPYNNSDGWCLEQRGADHDPLEADIIEIRDGTETTIATDVELKVPFTDWTRVSCTFNWYGVGRQEWKHTFTEDGRQINDELTQTSNDGEIGPSTGNLNLRYEITAGPNTTNLELHGGSMGVVTLGDPTSLSRSKPTYESITINGTNGVWEPFFAIRIDPYDRNVNMQFSEVTILNYGANANIEVVVASFTADKTDIADTDWSVPRYHHEENTALQSTQAVSQVANSNGVVKDFDDTDKFGGFTVATAIDIDGGGSEGASASVNNTRQEKKSVLGSDHVVFLARTPSTGSTLDLIWDVDQNW